MAKDQFSFDIVSEVAVEEVANALDQARREVTTRFDFKGTDTRFDRDEDLIEVRSASEHRVKAAVEVLKEKFVRRKISLKAIHEGPILPGARGTYRQAVHVTHGISDEKARELTKFIRSLPVKVQSQVQKDQIRVSAKKKDDLQATIKAIRERDFDLPLQFTNFRP